MHRFLATGAAVVVCTALLGIQQSVALVLGRATGGITTLITMGMALLGVWAIAVLREA